MQLTNSTISGNSAGSAGGIYYVQGQYPYTNEISNTIFNAGALGENIVNNGATVTSHGYNLSSDDGGGLLTGPGDQINTDPLLGPLQDHGGPTFTHVSLPGSPAIDAGDPNFTPPPFTTNVDRIFSASSMVALISVHLRNNHGRVRPLILAPPQPHARNLYEKETDCSNPTSGREHAKNFSVRTCPPQRPKVDFLICASH